MLLIAILDEGTTTASGEKRMLVGLDRMKTFKMTQISFRVLRKITYFTKNKRSRKKEVDII